MILYWYLLFMVSAYIEGIFELFDTFFGKYIYG